VSFLYNVATNRELREGDKIRVISGPRQNSEGMIVGFAVFGPRPVVVQYNCLTGLLRETFAANEVEVSNYTKAPESLEPLPEIRSILKDSQSGRLERRGRSAALVCENGTYTFVPTVPSIDFMQICESKSHQSIEEKILDLLRVSVVTRLPHLLQNV
jgi:hypothetical protein